MDADNETGFVIAGGAREPVPLFCSGSPGKDIAEEEDEVGNKAVLAAWATLQPGNES
jgi:hypothetical protein